MRSSVICMQARTRKLRLGAFQWQNCGSPSKELLVVPNLNILPDPIYFPGSVTVNATAMVNQTLDSSLQVNLFGTVWLCTQSLEQEFFDVC